MANISVNNWDTRVLPCYEQKSNPFENAGMGRNVNLVVHNNVSKEYFHFKSLITFEQKLSEACQKTHKNKGYPTNI